jgi:hypothetical protein
MRILLFVISIFCFFSCGLDNKSNDKNPLHQKRQKVISTMTLLEHVNLAINPKFQDWVLFENGTYIIFDNADTIADLKEESIKLMKEYGPVYAGSPAGDFSVTHLNKTEGWVVSGHCYGMYTYVNPVELETNNPDDVKIGLFGRTKREKDGKKLQIIHINRKK